MDGANEVDQTKYGIFRAFLPTSLVPAESLPSQNYAFTLFFICLYTLTYPKNRFLTILRVILAFPAMYLYYDHGFGPYEMPPGIDVGEAVIAIYGMMRVFETCFTGIFDDYPSVWMKMDTGEKLPLPTTILGRLAYAVDLLTSLRGGSWFKGIVWDWAPSSTIAKSLAMKDTRWQYIRRSIIKWAFIYLIVDLCDTIEQFATDLNWRIPHPLLGASPPIPIYKQSLYSFVVCAYTVFSMMSHFCIISSIAVALGSSPSSWPPLFDSPFSSKSLADFWGKRYHTVFRRTFGRLAKSFMFFVPSSAGKTLRTLIHTMIIFVFSCLLHILIMNRPKIPGTQLWDVGILKFFLLQPLGLLIESWLVEPLTSPLPRPLRAGLRRVYPWAWLFWSGRWWADVWIRRGFWEVRLVYVSLIRGVSMGMWVVGK
jgi:hypothetical protein